MCTKDKVQSLFAPTCESHYHPVQMLFCIYCNEWITYTRIVGLELFASKFLHLWSFTEMHPKLHTLPIWCCAPRLVLVCTTPSSSTFCNISWVSSNAQQSIWCGKVTKESYNAKVPKGRESSKCVPKTKFNHWFIPTCESHYHPVQMLFCIYAMSE